MTEEQLVATNEELVKWLRQGWILDRQAADRIEALTAKVKLMDDLDVINGEKIEALTEQLEAARADAKEAEAYAEDLERNQVDLCRQLIAAEDKLAELGETK